MKKVLRFCDVCGKECNDDIGRIHFTPWSCFGQDSFDVCDSCFKDIRKYIRSLCKK